MKKILLFLSFLLISIGVFGSVSTLTFTTKCNGSGVADNGISWIVTSDGIESNFENERGIHYGTNSAVVSYLNLSTSEITGTITQIKVNASGASNTKANLNVTVNGNDFDSQQSLTSTATEYTFNGSANGTIIVSLSQSSTTKALYCKSITVTYSGSVNTHTVIWVANNDTIYTETTIHNLHVDSVPHLNIDDYCDDAFIGWTNLTYHGSIQPSGLFTIATKPTITKDTTFYAVFGNYENGNITSFFKTELNEITTSDVFIIVGEKNGTRYAMSNDNGVDKDPDAPIVSPINDYISFPSDTVLWKLSGNNSDGYTFYPYNDNTKWLYCNTKTNKSNNDNLRVGNSRSSDRKLFIQNNDGYFENRYDTCSTRYVGVYTGKPDWRSYTSINSNIAGQTFEFYKGIREIDEYHTNTDCVRKFNNAQNDSLWTTKGNWTNNKITTIKYGARIDTAVIVNTAHAVAKHIIINQNTGNGKIIIQPNKGLEVDSTIVVSKNNSYHPTTPNDLILESSSEGNASLIFNNNNNSQATVQLYSKATYPENGTANWQYIGTSMTELSALYNYYGSWIYKWDDGWKVVRNGDNMTAWTGYCITQREETYHETTGTLEPTDTKVIELTVPANSDMVFANSWTAPIHVSKFTNADFTIDPQTVYLFNTGYAPDSSKVGTEAGTHVVIPIRSAPFIGDSLIASQQGFFVTNSSNEDKVIRLRYKDLVRTNGKDSIVAGSLHAPKRTRVSADKPNVMKIYATASYSDKVVILEREDFSTEFDNGWDGNKSSFGINAPSIYVINTDGTYDAVSAIPDYEGTVLGFKAGIDTTYNITFDYNGDDVWYLNDIKEQQSVLINSENTYTFESLKTDSEIRFIISQTPLNSGVTTNLVSNNQTKQQKKIIINNNIYIVNNGLMFDILGNIVK